MNLRRLIAAVCVTFTLCLGGVAHAAPTLPDPGGICAQIPDPVGDSDTVSSMLDIGRPPSTATGGGTYTARGWAGWSRPHLYDEGCMERVGRKVGSLVPGTFGDMVQEDPPNRVAGWVLGLTSFIGAGLTLLVRLGTAPGEVWTAVDLGEMTLRAVFGWQMFAAWVTVTVLAIGLWVQARARRDSLDRTVSESGTALLILGAGFIVAGWQFSVGPLVDGTITGAYKASGQVATASADPAAAFGDMFADRFLMPGWGVVHLGPNLDAVAEFAPRLHAAATFTRAEEAAIIADPSIRDALVQEKAGHYRTVVSEVKTKYPRAYEHLTGKGSTDDRPMWAFLLLLVVAPFSAVVAFLAGAVAASRLVLRYGAAAWPGVAVITAHPVLQHWGRVYASEFIKWLWIGCLSIVSLMGYVAVTGSVLTTASDAGWFARLLAVFLYTAALLWVWKTKREALIQRAGVQREAAAVKWARERVTPDRQEREPRTTAGSATPRATEPPVVVPAHVPFVGAPTGPPPRDGATTTEAVKGLVQARTNRAAADEARKVDRVRVPAKATPGSVTDAAHRLASARPTAASLARREAAALTARTSRPLPVKTGRSSTSMVAQTVSRPAVTVAANRMRKRAAVTTTAALSTGPVTGTAVRVAAAAATIRKRR